MGWLDVRDEGKLSFRWDKSLIAIDCSGVSGNFWVEEALAANPLIRAVALASREGFGGGTTAELSGW